MKKVVFLFNHDAAHQAAHLAGVAATFAAQCPTSKTYIAYADPAMRAFIAQLLPHPHPPNLAWHQLDLPAIVNYPAAALNRLAPVKRLARLWAHRAFLGDAAMLVSTERTCLQLKSFLSGRLPLFAIIPHGAGDRNVSSHPDYAKFDLLLVAGRKVQDQMVEAGVPAARIKCIGYPKFDTITNRNAPAMFANDHPVFVYNPHFDPYLSSWYDFGPDILRWFASSEGQQFNCIFAPHVMLFRKKLHVSLEYLRLAIRPDVPTEALAASNIHIDTGSSALFDMTYMDAADAYIGDMSSQIYEFIRAPRAAFFVRNPAHQAESEPPAWRLHWQAGPVVRDVKALVDQLPHWRAIAAAHRDDQQRLFTYTFHQSDEPATAAAARELAKAVGLKPSHQN